MISLNYPLTEEEAKLGYPIVRIPRGVLCLTALAFTFVMISAIFYVTGVQIEKAMMATGK